MGADTYDLLVSTRLETARLVIRTFQARDAGPWLAMVGDPEVRRFLPAGPVPTLELARRIIGERQGMERELGHAMWAVEDKTTGTFVGQCGLRPVDEGAGPEIDLAYHYTRASWNKLLHQRVPEQARLPGPLQPRLLIRLVRGRHILSLSPRPAIAGPPRVTGGHRARAEGSSR